MYFGVEGVEVLIVVFNELCKGFVLRFKRGAFQFVIPFFRKSNAFSGPHFAKNEGEFKLVRGVNSWVNQEVSVHGLQPS